MERLKELEVAIDAVLNAGKVLEQYFKNKNYRVAYKSKSGRGSPVTDADIDSNGILMDKIKLVFPDDGWLSEETVDDEARLEKERIWIVDPLDGTEEFLEGIPMFSISLALVENKVPILGVVYNPVSKELYFGVRGKGAYRLRGGELNGVFSKEREFQDFLIKSKNSPSSLEMSTVILSRKEINNVKLIREIALKFKDVKYAGGIAYKIVSVAGGFADAVVSVYNKSEWDLAGAHIIAEEAGLKVTDSYGENLYYNERDVRRKGVIVANESLHGEILKFIRGR
ncbi:MAG: inositol monophosphatase family protein [Candidatus Kryptonium sp.]